MTVTCVFLEEPAQFSASQMYFSLIPLLESFWNDNRVPQVLGIVSHQLKGALDNILGKYIIRITWN